MDKMAKQIADKIEYNQDDIARSKRANRIMRSKDFRTLCARLEALPSWADVENVSFSFWSREGDNGEIYLTLNREAIGSSLVRDIVRYGICHTMEKAKQYGGGSLRAEGKYTANEHLTITIGGYVPATCQVVYEDIEVPARTERRAKLICDPRDLQNDPEVPDSVADQSQG